MFWYWSPLPCLLRTWVACACLIITGRVSVALVRILPLQWLKQNPSTKIVTTHIQVSRALFLSPSLCVIEQVWFIISLVTVTRMLITVNNGCAAITHCQQDDATGDAYFLFLSVHDTLFSGPYFPVNLRVYLWIYKVSNCYNIHKLVFTVLSINEHTEHGLWCCNSDDPCSFLVA